MFRSPLARSRVASRLDLVLVAVVLLIVAVACGGDEGKVVADGAFAKDTGVPTLAIPTTLPDAKGKPCKKATGVKKVEGKPTVEDENVPGGSTNALPLPR